THGDRERPRIERHRLHNRSQLDYLLLGERVGHPDAYFKILKPLGSAAEYRGSRREIGESIASVRPCRDRSGADAHLGPRDRLPGAAGDDFARHGRDVRRRRHRRRWTVTAATRRDEQQRGRIENGAPTPCAQPEEPCSLHDTPPARIVEVADLRSGKHACVRPCRAGYNDVVMSRLISRRALMSAEMPQGSGGIAWTVERMRKSLKR